MALQAVKNIPLADQVFAQIARQILTGNLAPGENLQPERELAAVFGVNRHVVREAVKRLQQAGLVKVVHGGGTRVLDAGDNAGLDLLELMGAYVEFGAPMYRYWRSVLEMRMAVAGDMSRMCAERASQETKDELLEIVRKMRAEQDDLALLNLDERFWKLIAVGCENVAYRLALNTLLKVSYAVRDVTAMWMARELRACDFQSPVAEAIAAGDGAAAERATRATMQSSINELRAMYDPDSIEQTDAGPTGG